MTPEPRTAPRPVPGLEQDGRWISAPSEQTNLIALLALRGVLLVLVVGVLGVIFGLQPLPGGHGPSATARAEIPARYLHAGQRYGLPWSQRSCRPAAQS